MVSLFQDRFVFHWWRLDIPSRPAAWQATDVIEKPKQEVKGDLEKENATWTR